MQARTESKLANRFGVTGLLLTVAASVIGLLFQVTNPGIVDAAGWLQLGAMLLTVAGILRGSRRWLLSIPLIAVGGYLWLLEQGH
jgi:hypothetical protein